MTVQGRRDLWSENVAQPGDKTSFLVGRVPVPGVPKPLPPKGPITNGHKPGEKPDPEKGRKPDKPKPKGNGHKPKDKPKDKK